jgi:ABC-type sulfate transport system permease component
MRTDRRWIATAGALLFAVTLLYPLTAFFARIGPWQWSGDIRDAGLASVCVSLLLTTCAMFIIVVVGTPVALYITRCGMRERLV